MVSSFPLRNDPITSRLDPCKRIEDGNVARIRMILGGARARRVRDGRPFDRVIG
jgi:hypothetical protein